MHRCLNEHLVPALRAAGAVSVVSVPLIQKINRDSPRGYSLPVAGIFKITKPRFLGGHRDIRQSRLDIAKIAQSNSAEATLILVHQAQVLASRQR